MKKIFCVISHTHWDREWYKPFSAFRFMLSDLIDNLLEILSRTPEYVFHLDAQTVVLEDYLELHPDREELLKKYIGSGNILVGPWYLQNDFYLTNGECTVQNLETGIALAERFGRCGKVGYAADQFGNISQLPQILNGFGINSFVFGRGLREYAPNQKGGFDEVPLPAEFIWRAPDGTECLAVHLKYWYNNAQHIPDDPELAKLLLNINAERFEGLNVSPYILLMNGVDHLQAQADVLNVIASLKKEGIDVEQTTLDGYIAKVREFVKDKPLPVIGGALNRGADYDMLRGCWSSRIYLKRENVRCEDLLINQLEPLYTHLEKSFSGSYPHDELFYLWKQLLKNQPHDSICGCSVDPVHRHMEESFAQIRETGEELLNRGFRLLTTHNSNPYAGEKDYSVTVFNPCGRAESGVVEVGLKFLKKDGVKHFELVAPDGKRAEYEIVGRRDELLDVFSPLNLPGVLDAERVTIRFLVKDVPPYSTRVYAVVPANQSKSAVYGGDVSESFIENEYYKIANGNGALTIEDKRTGRVFVNPIAVEDCGDRGDSYVFRTTGEAPVIALPVAFSKAEKSSFVQRLSFRFSYQCPAHYDFKRLKPSRARAAQTVKITATLEKESEVIKIDYQIKNRAKDHRIRLLLESGLTGGALVTDSPFDAAERKKGEICAFTDSDTCHNSTFAEYSKGDTAFSVYTEGQHEAEDLDGKLAFTVLRATGIITRHGGTFQQTVGDSWLAPENQCLRTICGRMAFGYGTKKSAARHFECAKFFRVGFLSSGGSFDKYKYFGGRFAVQSAELEKLYYEEDKFGGATDGADFGLSIESDDIAVTRIKALKGGAYLIRLANLSDSKQTVDIRFAGRAYLCDFCGNVITRFPGENAAKIAFRKKQIVTIRVEGGGS